MSDESPPSRERVLDRLGHWDRQAVPDRTYALLVARYFMHERGLAGPDGQPVPAGGEADLVRWVLEAVDRPLTPNERAEVNRLTDERLDVERYDAVYSPFAGQGPWPGACEPPSTGPGRP